MANTVEKSVELKAPMSRVWRALTDYREFGEWFAAELDGPFVPGQASRGHVTEPGYEHVQLAMVTQEMQPERLFSYTWHPYAVDPEKDYSSETPTLVVFTLEQTPNGTLLAVTESGFDKLPAERRDEAYAMHEDGWAAQMSSIEEYVREHP